MRKPWLPIRLVKTKTINKLKERRRRDNKLIGNLMAMNHSLIQFFNTLPPKYKKGLSAKVKHAKVKRA